MVECAIDDAKLTKLTRPEKGVTLAQVYRVMGRLDELSRVGADVLSRSQSDLQKLEENLKRTREKIEEQKSILRKYDAGFAYTILLQLLMSAACLLGINAGYQSSRAHAYEAVSIRRKRRLVDMMILLRSTEQKISPRIARQAMIEARDNPFSPKGNQDGLEMANTRTLTRTLGKLMGIAKMMRPDAQLPASPIDTTSSRKSATDEKPAKPAKP